MANVPTRTNHHIIWKFCFVFKTILWLCLLIVITSNNQFSLISALPINATQRAVQNVNNNNELEHQPVVQLKPEDLKRPDHLYGVKLERDGHLNAEFHKEAFLGAKKLDDADPSPEKILTDAFAKADTNKDAQLSLDELSHWISLKVNEHLDEAVKENLFLFTAIDKDHNGLVTWNEYHFNYMVNQGFGEEYAKEHAENHRKLDRKVREQILLDQAAFSEAAHTNPEGLNIDEFLSFRHPEHSHVTLFNMVQEIFNNLDEDSDNSLTLHEFTSFSAIPAAAEIKENDELWKQERKREFEESIDADHDGKVTRQELLFYSDPKNPAHSKMEARNLIALADVDGNGELSLDEILEKKDVFLGSKMVNPAQTFHDEF